MTSTGSSQDGASSFDHCPRTRLIFGAGTASRVGELARETGGTRVLVVTDPGIRKAGHAAPILAAVEAAGLKAFLFDQVRENPSTRDVDQCLAAAREFSIDLLIGLGGGSSMDTAKGCNFLLTNGGRMADYWGVGKATKPMLPLIAIPTTAGTGSECQSAALIADEKTHQKMACLDPKAAARIAVLDPLLTLSQPQGVTACTGLDAIAHALETAVTTKRSPISRMYSNEAFRLCANAFERVLTHPGDIEARGRMLLGAALAGLAIENSMLGAAHSAANPLTAHHGIPHGHAVGLMLVPVIQWNAGLAESRQDYQELAREAGLDGCEALQARVGTLIDATGLKRRLRDCGVPHEALPGLAEEAARQWTAGFNPRPVDAKAFLAMYESVF